MPPRLHIEPSFTKKVKEPVIGSEISVNNHQDHKKFLSMIVIKHASYARRYCIRIYVYVGLNINYSSRSSSIPRRYIYVCYVYVDVDVDNNKNI